MTETVNDIFEFHCDDKNIFKVHGRGNAYTVQNPKECNDFDYLMNQKILMNGRKRTVIGVDRFAHCPPWRKDELISLLLET